jgi:hypothetical protein
MRLLLLSLPFLFSTLGNTDVVKLVKAGLSAETIEMKIAMSDTDFDTSTDALVALAHQGVPDRIIRTMIEYDEDESLHPRVPAAPPTPVRPLTAGPAAPAPPASPAAPPAPRLSTRRYDVVVHGENGGKCDAELRVDGRGIRATRCRMLDFDIAWPDLDSVCYDYGFRGTLILKTEDEEYRVSTDTPSEARRVVEQIRASRPGVEVEECP